MKIIKSCSFRRNPRLRASPGHGGECGVYRYIVQTLIRRGGAPSGEAGFIVNNYEGKTIPLRTSVYSSFMGIRISEVP